MEDVINGIISSSGMDGEISGGSADGNINAGGTVSGDANGNQNIAGEVDSINLNANLGTRSINGTIGIGVSNYNFLSHKPQINEVELINNKNLEDLNVTRLTNSEIESLINSIV